MQKKMRFFCIVEFREGLKRPFTSAGARGTNPHATRPREILCGEFPGYPQRLDGDHHTPTHNRILKASEVGVVQIQFWQKEIARLHRASGAPHRRLVKV